MRSTGVIADAALAGDEGRAISRLVEHYERTIDILMKSGVIEKFA